MGFGSDFKGKMDRILDNTAIRSTAIHYPKTKTIGSYGGYESPSEASGTTVTINCIPSSYFGSKFIDHYFGQFNASDVNLVVKGNVTLGEGDHITFKTKYYKVTEVKPIILNDVVVANIVSLSKITS